MLADAVLLVTLAAASLAAAMMAAVALVPETLISANTARALALLAPMILGQALLDLLLAATRWRHLIRYEVAGRAASSSPMRRSPPPSRLLAGYGRAAC